MFRLNVSMQGLSKPNWVPHFSHLNAHCVHWRTFLTVKILRFRIKDAFLSSDNFSLSSSEIIFATSTLSKFWYLPQITYVIITMSFYSVKHFQIFCIWYFCASFIVCRLIPALKTWSSGPGQRQWLCFGNLNRFLETNYTPPLCGEIKAWPSGSGLYTISSLPCSYPWWAYPYHR